MDYLTQDGLTMRVYRHGNNGLGRPMVAAKVVTADADMCVRLAEQIGTAATEEEARLNAIDHLSTELDRIVCKGELASKALVMLERLREKEAVNA